MVSSPPTRVARRKAPKIIGDQLRSDAAAQEVMPGETSGEVMHRKTSPEVRLLRRRPLRSTVEWFSVLQKESFQVSRCKLQEEERRPFSQALLSKLVTDIQQKSIAEILKQVQNDGM